MPSSIDLLDLLQNWVGPEDLRGIREEVSVQLDLIVADRHMSLSEQVHSCQMALEAMNTAIIEKLEQTYENRGSPRNQSPSSSNHAGEFKGNTEEDTPLISQPESRAESDVTGQESGYASISSEMNITTTFAISKEENDCFRALFKAIVTTPRKMRRVVNV